MKNRGQFFLVGAFVIIVVIFGFIEIFVYASSAKLDSQSEVVSSRLKDEAGYLIDQSSLNGLSESQLIDSIKNLTYYYSLNYPRVNITIIYGYSSNINAIQYYDGKSRTLPQRDITTSNNDVTLNLNNRYYYFNLTEGYNFFVISQKSGENELAVSTK